MYNNNLYKARKERGKTQAEIAQVLDMNVTVYSRYERGDRDIPLSVAARMAKLLNVSIDYIAGYSKSTKGIGIDEENEQLTKTIIDPITSNVGNEKEMLEAYIRRIEEDRRKANETSDNAINEIRQIIAKKYPDNQ